MNNPRGLHPSFMQAIVDRFNVLDTIDLFEYDHKFNDLYTRLKLLRKDRFDPNDKIVLLHFDTDFYTHQDRPGILLSNLHLILSKLDIPFSFILLITNHQLDDELKQLCTQYSTEPVAIQHIVTNFQQLLINDGSDIVDDGLFHSNIQYHFSCLNGRARSHRKFLIAILDNCNLLEKGLVSYHDSK